ncbi:type VI secretion system-associated FHA domain protein TagH [Pseudomonas sp. 10B1]|uniref:type VI secretion system-associated FHA domain protein TagH n=1 Tax=unclassified Pseudomonas TaxID=196821 RepID=UPI002AB5C605|nr:MULTISPECIES: type VI secretion system-associated FHA domain protein TagH [unclassified Pseudomonas]MDY7562601.1 type VI secretion system-associated FHA domain protein TagH [Pseudomonas sp. AB6]MEA9979626.1 type VI secretion system-associated FHA domain protein TagH [Pseudomonas sp. RTS4]MEA9997286.1 type VI secretion system-associated FHA domain protein TagH [Pseudomonas sp. AA4]MEB0087410.1 type VI secretion system-associated FHA domain protein TagH [Pseudomonas sp. RTI1]MEB0128490.1 type
MQLVLEIVNTEQAAPSQQLRCVFEPRGGAIGRLEYSDWVIVDHGSQVSRQHAQISFNGSHFLLRDISTNGVRLKATGERLVKESNVRIEDGAVYVIGPFDIRAQVIRKSAESNAASAQSVVPRNSLIIPEDVNFGLSPMAATQQPSAIDTPTPEPQQCADYAPIQREHLIVPTLIPPTPEPDAAPAPAPLPDPNEMFWQRFAEALGLSVDDLDQPSREVLAVETARLFKLSIGNLQQSLRTRTELKNELRLALTTGQYTQRNPIKHAATASDAVKGLLLDPQLRTHAERSIVRSFNDLQAHQVAMLSASRAALRSTLEHFAPQHLALRFERDGHQPLFSTDGGLWRAYGRYHHALGQDDDWSERLLARDFAQAYEEQVRLIDSLHTDPQG